MAAKRGKKVVPIIRFDMLLRNHKNSAPAVVYKSTVVEIQYCLKSIFFIGLGGISGAVLSSG